jgi:excisionase family DNA binding protein
MSLAGRVYTTGEVAVLLLVAPRHVRQWVERGALRAGRTAGGHLRISHEDLLACLDTHWPTWRQDLRAEYVGPRGAPSDSWRQVMERRLRQWPWLREWLVLLGCEREFGLAQQSGDPGDA